MISEGKGQKVNLNLSGRHGGPGLVGSRICEEVRFGFGRSGYTVCMYVTCGSLQRTTYAQCSTVYIRVNVRLILLLIMAINLNDNLKLR